MSILFTSFICLVYKSETIVALDIIPKLMDFDTCSTT